MDTVSLHVAVASALENAIDTPYGGTKFLNIPDDMTGLSTPHKPVMFDPLPTIFNASHFAYLCALDQVNDEQDPERILWTPTSIIDHALHKDRSGFVAPMYRVTWPVAQPSWIHATALLYQCPELVRAYFITTNLESTDLFVSIFGNDDAVNPYVTALKASTVNPKKFKFGVEVPSNPGHAKYLDKLYGYTGTDSWEFAIKKELDQLSEYATFQVVDDDRPMDTAYKKIPYQIIFDVKFDLRKKARLVAGGHMTDTPTDDIYSGVVEFMSVRLCFMIAAMNGLQICAADVGNAFLYGVTKEKVYIIAGKEFGPALAGKRLIIAGSLYGLKSSAARFHENLSANLRQLGYLPSKADADLWMKKVDGHWEYIATYVDDILSFSKNPMAVIKSLEKTYVLKGVGEPEYYLGGDITITPEAKVALTAQTYILRAVEKYEDVFGGAAFRMYQTPMEEQYHPELDESDFLTAKETSLFRGLIGSANWMITLGRFDIHYAVNTLSRFSMAPRQTHLQAMIRVFGYLK
jgi:Reverse transcriptase (RNA-dependent DNA polymerase)